MYGQSLQTRPWHHVRRESSVDRQRKRLEEPPNAAESAVARAVKSIFLFLGCLLFNVVGLMASAVVAIGALLLVPLLVFTAFALFCLCLGVVGLLLSGIGLV